jgi:hypothetical protein
MTKFLVIPVLAFVQSGFLPSCFAASYESWYPKDITPPAGVVYHCNLTPLPPDLNGITDGDKAFINHVYSMVLRMIQYKEYLLSAMQRRKNVDKAYELYLAATKQSLDKIRQEPAPKGLNQFKEDVIAAGNLQMQFFSKAVEECKTGKSMEEIYKIPEGKQASSKLFSAWGAMSARYQSWPANTKDSVYHHLCALDLF